MNLSIFRSYFMKVEYETRTESSHNEVGKRNSEEESGNSAHTDFTHVRHDTRSEKWTWFRLALRIDGSMSRIRAALGGVSTCTSADHHQSGYRSCIVLPTGAPIQCSLIDSALLSPNAAHIRDKIQSILGRITGWPKTVLTQDQQTGTRHANRTHLSWQTALATIAHVTLVECPQSNRAVTTWKHSPQS